VRRLALIATYPLRYLAFLAEEPRDSCPAALILAEQRGERRRAA
jgi:hypothetical protein